MKKICVIDLADKKNERFLLANIVGKVLFSYVIDKAICCNIFDKICVKTRSRRIIDYIKKYYINRVDIINKNFSEKNSNFCYISGLFPLLSTNSIIKANKYLKGNDAVISVCKRKKIELKNNKIIESNEFITSNILYVKRSITKINKIKKIEIPYNELIKVDNQIAFETVLSLIRKQNNSTLLVQSILNRIKEKKNILINSKNLDGVLLMGNSLFDKWNIKKISHYQVRNCGINGITDFQYYDLIIKNNNINFDGKYIFYIGVTNDIIYDYLDSQIVACIKNIFKIIKKHSNAQIFYVECPSVNGRMDRNNNRIKKINSMIKKQLPRHIKYVSLKNMNNNYDELKYEYTVDGLHFSKLGYKKLEDIISKKVSI